MFHRRNQLFLRPFSIETLWKSNMALGNPLEIGVSKGNSPLFIVYFPLQCLITGFFFMEIALQNHHLSWDKSAIKMAIFCSCGRWIYPRNVWKLEVLRRTLDWKTVSCDSNFGPTMVCGDFDGDDTPKWAMSGKPWQSWTERHRNRELTAFFRWYQSQFVDDSIFLWQNPCV